jgi:transposase InsO family protein
LIEAREANSVGVALTPISRSNSRSTFPSTSSSPAKSDSRAAKEVAEMIRTAVKKHGGPKYYVSDHGLQFTSDHFRAALKRLGISQRFGTIGKYGSIAIIERLWRSLKDLLLLRSRRAWSPAEMMRRLDDGVYYYAFHKPHQGLAGATPSEVYFGLPPLHLEARRPPANTK